MTYPIKALVAHPGRNPHWAPGIRVSRWIPHNGKREMARRVRQALK